MTEMLVLAYLVVVLTVMMVLKQRGELDDLEPTAQVFAYGMSLVWPLLLTIILCTWVSQTFDPRLTLDERAEAWDEGWDIGANDIVSFQESLKNAGPLHDRTPNPYKAKP